MMYPFLVLAQFDWRVSVDDVLKAGHQVNFSGCDAGELIEDFDSNERRYSVKAAVTV